jgi:ABC-2 type transport system ATP-binding protein
MMPAHVYAAGLQLAFGRRPVVDGVHLLAQGGLTTVLGANGAGKSTLLRCLATILTPHAGVLRIDGLDPLREPERIEIRTRLGYLPQAVGLAAGATVFDSVEHVAVLKRHDDDRRRRRLVYEALDRVGLAATTRERVERLSGGMARRVGLAQALLGAPTLLVLDEPGSGLDPDERLRLREILTERRATCTTIVSTHLTEDAAISDTVLVLDGGWVRFSGRPAQLAALAAGRTWVHGGLPPPGVRASWRLTDGRYRCLGDPPPGAELVEPTLEDGYLLTRIA